MRVKVVADEGDPDDGFVGERLLQHGARLERVWRDELPTLTVDLEGLDLLLLLGSERAVHDEAQRRVVDAEQLIFRRAEQRGLPVLAICYGAQLVAAALGSRVTPAERPEVGWTTLETSDELLCPTGPWFEFHFDRWSEIPGVTPLAWTKSGPQSFVSGRTAGYQFHPEVTSATAQLWLASSEDKLRRLGFAVGAIAAETEATEAAARVRCHQLVDRFLGTVADLVPRGAPDAG